MERIETGKIVNTHGIRGELKIQPWADGPESLTGLSVLYLDAAGTRPLEIERARVHQGNVICKFRGVDSIESAQAYKGRIVYTDKDERSLAPGEYYIADVIGLTVVDADTGEEYGRLTDVYQAPANDAYEIELASGRRVLFPAIRDVVIETDIRAGLMRVRPIAGMFDI